MASLGAHRWKTSFAALALCVAATAHGVFAWHYREHRPDFVVLDAPPTPMQRSILAFGDTQFLYRYWSSYLQNAGDTGGRATRMRDYNYDDVLGWLRALQSLDGEAQQHTFLAAHYFSQTPNTADVRRIIAFVVDDVTRSPARKWYWLTFVMPLAEKRLNDTAYALEISRQLAGYDFPDMSGWNYVFPAIYLDRLGRTDEARAEIARMLEARKAKLGPEHLQWAAAFTHGLEAQPK